ncbi:hypothetical protein WD019_20245 [Fictibacillus sp. Mic-4]|uniref:hypothetical protein n=1 Tax=Fictibacillus sp. Mic-4 TaxID=3132826 RepID=UPI003CFB68A2
MPIKRRFLYINDASPLQSQPFTWRKEWISPYESPWSIFEKFKYANRATVKDLFDLFGTTYSKSLKASNLSQKACNLITLEGLDESLLKKAFGLSIKEVNRRTINMLTNIFQKDDQQLYFHTILKLCPKCIKIGYHSIFHQFSLVHRCPFHNVSFVEGCPKCKRTMFYQLTDRYTKEPFQCKCGHLLFSLKNGQRYPVAWKQMSIQNQFNPLKYWITFNLNNVHEKFFLNIHPDSDLQKNDGVMEFILEAVSSNYKTNRSEIHRKVTFSSRICNLQLKDEHYEFNLKKEIYQSSRATIRSIVSHIQKIFDNHSSCIRRLTTLNFNYSPYKPFKNCPYAFSFVHWRQFIEGADSVYDLGLKRKEVPFFNSTEYYFATNQDHNYLNDLLFWLRKACQIENIATLKWIINRVMSHLTVNHLKNWLRISHLYVKKKVVFYAAPFNLEHLPFFLIIIPKNQSHPIEFHWWTSKETLHIDNLLQTDLACPFVTERNYNNFFL